MSDKRDRWRPMVHSGRRWRVAGALAGLGAALAVTTVAVVPKIAGGGEGTDSAGGPPAAIAPPVNELALQLEEALHGPLPGVPEEYQEMVREAAATCAGLPPTVLAAQIEAESTWNPTAVSEAGAKGIAQFLPSTWKHFGVDANGNGTADPFEPEDAIYSAAAYDCDLYQRVSNVPGDRVANMLAAYHAGPGAVVEAGGLPPILATSQYVWRIYTIGLRNTQEALKTVG